MTLKILVLGISLMMFNACDKDYDSTTPIPQSTSINKILPLGASRVEGARPEFESFRYELWKDLKENDWTFDFIGTQKDLRVNTSIIANIYLYFRLKVEYLLKS